jgi:hypothetical protein
MPEIMRMNLWRCYQKTRTEFYRSMRDVNGVRALTGSHHQLDEIIQRLYETILRARFLMSVLLR